MLLPRRGPVRWLVMVGRQTTLRWMGCAVAWLSAEQGRGVIFALGARRIHGYGSGSVALVL